MFLKNYLRNTQDGPLVISGHVTMAEHAADDFRLLAYKQKLHVEKSISVTLPGPTITAQLVSDELFLLLQLADCTELH